AAVWGTRGLVAMIPESLSLPNVTAVRIDRNVLLFAVLVTLATGVLFGLAPALRAGRVDLRAALVVAEVALSMVLLVGAGLLIRSFARLLQVDAGFVADWVLTLRLSTG